MMMTIITIIIIIIINLFWALGVFQFTKSFSIGQTPSKTVEAARKRLEFSVSWTREKKFKAIKQLTHSSRKG